MKDLKKTRNRVLFYSSVKDKSLFTYQGFYQTDIQLLKQLGYQVILSNSIKDAFQFWKYDLVYAYFYRYSTFVALIARVFCRRVYFTGGIDKLDSHWASLKERTIQKVFFLICYLLSTKCIIVSKTDLENVEKILKFSHKKISYSEHTIDTESYSSDIPPKENMFCTIAWQGKGNIYRKGIDVALKIYERMINDGLFANSKFLLIGKEDEGTQILKEMVNNLKLTNNVIFTGGISESEKIKYLKRSRFYFQLSVYEGFGIAALEALCSKCIVIHSGMGGLSNPIYNYGIKFDRNNRFEMEYEKLLSSIKNFDARSLDKASAMVSNNYSNNRRKMDLLSILN